MTPTPPPSTGPFDQYLDLASSRLGGAVLYANDEFFAEKENLVKDAAAVFHPTRYTERGKWMDGWESRRRREPGFDWCIVRLGYRGRIHGVIVDTSFFVGNYPPAFRIEGIDLGGVEPPTDWAADRSLEWRELVPKSPLEGGALNPVPIAEATAPVTHLRFAIYPDGGVARLRVYGEVSPYSEPASDSRAPIDLAALEVGGRVVGVSDDFFSHRHNLLLPGPSRGMFDGWETRRRRLPGNDWVVVRLGQPGRLAQVEVDTSWFRGNAPGACTIEATTDTTWSTASTWTLLLPKTPLRADDVHRFDLLAKDEPWTHVRLQIFPDGGVARLRLLGWPTPREGQG